MRTATTGKIKIAYLIGTLDLGGTERQLVALAEGLDWSRFVPVVFCLSVTGPLVADLKKAGVEVKCLGLRGLRVWRNPIRLARRLLVFLSALKKEKPELVHGFLFHACVLGTFAAKIVGVPIVIAGKRSLGHFKAGKPHYLLAERLANRMTDTIVANSEAVKREVIRQERVGPSEVRVIYNGIEPSLFEIPVNLVLKASLGVPEKAKVVGVVANFIRYKGHQFFLEGWASVVEKFPESVALLVGDGPLRGEFKAKVDAKGLRESVRFLGTRDDVPELLALMDVVVHPSLQEGFSNAVLEAMAAGKPVVATAVGGNPEAVVHGETGLLVPPRDSQALAEAMLWLLDHPADADRFGQAGRRRVAERFGLSAMVRQYEAVYESLVAENCSGRAQVSLRRGRGTI